MFKEILVFMLWLQFSNGSRSSWGSGGIGKVTEISNETIDAQPPLPGSSPAVSCKEKANEFLEEMFLVGDMVPINFAKICILSNYQIEEIKEPPEKYSKSLSQTRINIEMSQFQVQSINEDSIGMSFFFKVNWVDQRLQVLQFKRSKDYPFTLDESQQKNIWIPHLELKTEIISNEKKVDHVTAGIRGNFTPNSPIDVGPEGWVTSGAWVEQGISVITRVACELDFKRFPFDHHVCSIQVLKICSNILFTYVLR